MALQRPSVDYAIYVDGALSSTLKAVSILDSAGAERLDTAVLEVVDGVLDDYAALDWMNKEVEIVRTQTGEVVHWGKTTVGPTSLNRDGETIQVTSRTEPYHIGNRVDGYWIWDPVAAEVVHVDGELVFNPLIDGSIYGNLNDTQVTLAGDPLLLDPESVRTTAAQTLQGANVDLWSLAGTVYYLLWSLNTSQTYVANLSLAALAAIFTDTAAVVRDVWIPRGTYLAEALDMVLGPLGYQWKVNRTGIGTRTFAFWKRGMGGTLRQVTHQRPGNALVVASTNVETLGINFDVAALANQVTLLGGFGEYELTAELARGWATADDPPQGINDELSKDNPDFDNVKNVLRKWVLNEAGDYIGLRTEIDGVFTSDLRTALTSAGILQYFVPRRRRLLPTLTLDDDGTPIGKVSGVEVEYSIAEGTPDWKPIDGLQTACSLLEREAGIYFDANRLPDEFLGDPPNLRIRATFTLQSDLRLQALAGRQSDSPNEDIVPLVVSAPDRFRHRVVANGLSKYYASGLPSLAVDDSTPIANFAAFSRDAWDIMKVGGVIQLEGLDQTYYVGDRISGIALKNVSFEAKDTSGIYPQIVAIERNVTTQTMAIHLDVYRDPLTLPPPTRGTRSRFAPRNTSRRVIQ